MSREMADPPRGRDRRHDDVAGDGATPSVEGAVQAAMAERARNGDAAGAGEAIFALSDMTVRYGGIPAVADITLEIYRNNVTALIGPSGSGKSTLIRALNRMNDLVPSATVEGRVLYHGEDLYGPQVDPVQVRQRIGMVFQRPNPFPKSIYDNIAFGPRVLGRKGNMDEVVETALRRGALWDEVKDRLKTNAFGMSGGQQQRLCIARALATQPDVLLMDEPCSALDPISTLAIEDLIAELKQDYTIVIVTHNMQQAARVSDQTAFFNLEATGKPGKLIEIDDTEKIFSNPTQKATEDYISGRFG